jgi:hypothetical protein
LFNKGQIRLNLSSRSIVVRSKFHVFSLPFSLLVVLWDVSNHPTGGTLYEAVDSLEIQATFFLLSSSSSVHVREKLQADYYPI